MRNTRANFVAAALATIALAIGALLPGLHGATMGVCTDGCSDHLAAHRPVDPQPSDLHHCCSCASHAERDDADEGHPEAPHPAEQPGEDEPSHDHGSCPICQLILAGIGRSQLLHSPVDGLPAPAAAGTVAGVAYDCPPIAAGSVHLARGPPLAPRT